MFKNRLLILFFLISLYSCKEKNITPPENLLEEYFPLKTGSYIIYDAKMIKYVNRKADTVNFQIKEVNKGEFLDQEGLTNYRIERFKRENDTQGWEIDSVWYIIKKTDRIIKVENNIPLVKLVYPVSEKTQWDANTMNNVQYEMGGYMYKLYDTTNYQSLKKSYQLDGFNFENTIRVYQRGNTSTSLDSVCALNIYSSGLGRIFTSKASLQLCNVSDTIDCVFRQRIDGHIYQEKYKEHGTE